MTKRALSSERIAKGLLERLEYQVIEVRKDVLVEGVKVAEVDLVVQDKSGEKFSVEVKAGRIGVTDIRQAYSNAQLLGLKAIIVCKGYADAAAEAIARELKVKVIELAEYYILLEPEELESIVRQAVLDSLEESGILPLMPIEFFTDEDKAILRALAESGGMEEAAKKLGFTSKDFGRRVGELRRKGILPLYSRGYEVLRRQATRILARVGFEERVKRVEEALKKIEGILVK